MRIKELKTVSSAGIRIKHSVRGRVAGGINARRQDMFRGKMEQERK